jgi:hypothetical protein
MKATQKYPRISYPYLAVWTGPDTPLEQKNYPLEDIVVVSMIQENQDEDLKPFVQPLIGGKKGYFTKNEEEYSALPQGYEITLTQEP